MLREIQSHISSQVELSPDEIAFFLDAVSSGEISDNQIASFLTGLLKKGVTANEVLAISKVMRERSVSIHPGITDDLLDTCGTGGGLSTFNISTATAIVCAAAGIPVAKHGSRSISSLCGSADVMEALGVNLTLSVPAIEQMIREVGIAFIHAPDFHPIMRRILPIERALGIKTIFYTVVGPLINPAAASRHLLGVYRPDLLELTAKVVTELRFKRAMIVYGLDGVDEISMLGKTRIYDLIQGQLSCYEIEPENFGLKRCSLRDIRSISPEGNAALINGVFQGKIKDAPRNAIVLNSAGALIVGGRASNFAEGIQLASDLIDNGSTWRKLQELIEASISL